MWMLDRYMQGFYAFLQFPLLLKFYRPVGQAVTRSSLEREVWGSNLGPVKLDTVLPTARHRCDIFSKAAVLPWRNDAEMGPANSLHASAYYSECNKRFDLTKLSPPSTKKKKKIVVAKPDVNKQTQSVRFIWNNAAHLE